MSRDLPADRFNYIAVKDLRTPEEILGFLNVSATAPAASGILQAFEIMRQNLAYMPFNEREDQRALKAMGIPEQAPIDRKTAALTVWPLAQVNMGRVMATVLAETADPTEP